MRKSIFAVLLVGMLCGAQAYAKVTHEFDIAADTVKGQGINIIDFKPVGINATNLGCSGSNCHFETEVAPNTQGTLTFKLATDDTHVCTVTIHEGAEHGTTDPTMEMGDDCAQNNIELTNIIRWNGNQYVMVVI